MKRRSLATGAWAGGLFGALLVALLYLGWQLLRLPFVPYDAWNWQARVVPGNMLSLAVSGIGYYLALLLGAQESEWGKVSEQVGAWVLFIVLLALLGLVVAWIRRRTDRSGRTIGLITGAVLFLIVMAIELTLPLRAPLPLVLLWLGLLFLAWGFGVGAVLDGVWLTSLSAAADPERRQGLIKLAGGAVAALLAAWGLGRLIGAERESLADQPLDLGTPAPIEPPDEGVAQADATPLPSPTPQPAAEIPVGEDGRIVPAPGTREEITPNGQFYRVDINATPIELDGTHWRLIMAGLFESTPRLTLNDLRAYPIHTQSITLSCISNPIGGTAISSAYWTGLRLRDLVEDLGMLPEANFLFIQSADGFYETVPMEDVMDPQTLLVYGMNNRTLPVRHGFPLRIFIPNRYGMKQPKWIERIEAVTDDQGGYWTDRGWSKEARPNTTSVIDTVATEAEQNGYIPVGGIAWAGSRGIQKVEVSVNNVEWMEATLRTPPIGPLMWVQWRHEWLASPGNYTFLVRATDGEGELQTSERSGTLPDGATGYHMLATNVDEDE